MVSVNWNEFFPREEYASVHIEEEGVFQVRVQERLLLNSEGELPQNSRKLLPHLPQHRLY